MDGIAGLVVLSLQGVILGLLVVAVRRRNAAAAANACGALFLALSPALVELVGSTLLGRQLVLGPILPLWISIAGVLHSIGMLGPYDTTWWWDHLTHTVSAALVAALVYAVVVTADPLAVQPGLAPVATVGGTVAIGAGWEAIELVARGVGERFDVEPLLVHYGWRDTAVDLGFDVVGAVLVVGTDLRLFVPVVEQLSGVGSAGLIGTAGVVVDLAIAGLVVSGARLASA